MQVLRGAKETQIKMNLLEKSLFLKDQSNYRKQKSAEGDEGNQSWGPIPNG